MATDLEEVARREIAKVIGPLLVDEGRAVLTERTHIKTGELRRTLRWRRSGPFVRISGKFYGRIVNDRAQVMKKDPPGPLPTGWIEEATRRAFDRFQLESTLLGEEAGAILRRQLRLEIRKR